MKNFKKKELDEVSSTSGQNNAEQRIGVIFGVFFSKGWRSERIKGYKASNIEGLAGKEAGETKMGKGFGKSKVVLGFVNRTMSTSMNAETGRAFVNLQEIVGNSLVEQKNLQGSGNFKKNTLMQMVR